ncbi:MAG TPA: peptidase [Mycobacteriales bacterium]|nr:peptidase [Mycobacteriales bacterium]
MRLTAIALVAAASVVAGAAPASALAATHRPSRAVATVRGDLPADAPRALYRREPRLPAANGWPGSNEAFPRTSGTGRLADGGFYWTDFLYDDHGTTTASVGDIAVTAGSPSFGTYTYPPGAAHNNGADIFRTAVLRRAHATYWRVDWTTLASPRVPIAEWTFDRDADPKTGGSTWPAGAGVRSAGIDTAMVVSSQGARVLAVPSGRLIRRLPVTVDRRAQSFVVRVPDSVLRPTGRWRIRLAAGLANPAGTGFARPPDALPTEPAVYNVTFRSIAQEAPRFNFWDDVAQTRQLLAGNVTPFSATVRWSRLAHRVRTPQPRPTGWSDRWYVSDVDLGAGMVAGASTILDGDPNYLGRVQPYAVYVPTSYRPRHPAPLTFLLHSLTQDHNQYAATTPRFSRLACQDRHAICVTPLGRGPDGNYWDYAELDFWQVWHAVAKAYRLNPNRTILSGYSMGGIGTNSLAMAHPDLFAKAVSLAGGIGTDPSVVNLRWIPTYLAGGLADELVPVTLEAAEANQLAALGNRFRWLLYPATDHIAFELEDAFGDAAHYMDNPRRVRNPGSFTFTWVPRNTPTSLDQTKLLSGGIPWTQRPGLGVGTTGDYWVRDLTARSASRDATVAAHSGERPERAVTSHLTRNVALSGGPGPGLATTQTWTRGRRPAAKPVITLRLTNVRSLRVLPAAAGFAAGHAGRLRVTTDGRTTIHVGDRAIHLGRGHHVVRLQDDGNG